MWEHLTCKMFFFDYFYLWNFDSVLEWTDIHTNYTQIYIYYGILECLVDTYNSLNTNLMHVTNLNGFSS